MTPTPLKPNTKVHFGMSKEEIKQFIEERKRKEAEADPRNQH